MDDDSSQDYLQRSRWVMKLLPPLTMAHCEPQIRGADSHENATYCRGNEHSATCAHKVRARCSYRLPPTEFGYCFRDTQRSASLNRYLLIAGGRSTRSFGPIPCWCLCGRAFQVEISHRHILHQYQRMLHDWLHPRVPHTSHPHESGMEVCVSPSGSWAPTQRFRASNGRRGRR